jgi:D-alanyl-D-alanine carboxypeptidase
LCAKAGHSEHQSWYAIDFYSASTQAEWMGSNTLKKYFDWLNANAHVYGFTNTYRKWVEVDGYQPEPWHWRYVGEPLARYLKQHDLTFAEFYYAGYPQ